MHRLESMLRPGRQILAFDPTGGGRAAEVFGDLDRAATGLGRRARCRHRSLDLRAHRAGELGARRHGASRSTAPSAGPARHPYGGDRLGRLHRARRARRGRRHRAARRGRRGPAARPGATRCPASDAVSLFCHSYGSVVCGVAARDLPANVERHRGGRQPRHAGRQPPRSWTPSARVWAMRDSRRLDRGRALHGGRRPRPRRRPGRSVLRRPDPVGRRRRRARRLLRAGHRQPAQLRRCSASARTGTVACASADPHCRSDLPEPHARATAAEARRPGTGRARGTVPRTGRPRGKERASRRGRAAPTRELSGRGTGGRPPAYDEPHG